MGINEKTGEVFSVAAENAPVAGCTVSKAVAEVGGGYVAHFSLAAGTDISAETYSATKVWLVASGSGAAFTSDGREWPLKADDAFTIVTGVPIGVKSADGLVYTEIEFGNGTKMNKILEAGKAFALKDVLPYAEGRIVNMDLASGPNMKFVLMSFDVGTWLSEHSAPGDALIFALEGEATIGYEGAEHVIKAGENFKFAKNGRHWVKANGRFKMALLLTLD